MRYIQLIRFTDLCSNAMLAVIDDICYKSYFIGQDGIIVNLTEERNKKLFEYFLEIELDNMSSYGKIPIITNTCRPWDNWRQGERGRAVKASKYAVLDDSVRIDTKRLEQLIDTAWKDVTKRTYMTVQLETVDTFDCHRIMTEMIGDMFITDVRPELRIIEDSNYMYDHSLPTEIPHYLYQEVETLLDSINI